MKFLAWIFSISLFSAVSVGNQMRPTNSMDWESRPLSCLSSYRNGQVKTSSLYESGEFIGMEVVFARRYGHVKAKYFATGDMPNRLYEFRKEKDVILACSGAFTDLNGTPVGLTIEAGVPKNRVLDHTMDGLVIVYPNGGIAVSDLDKGGLQVGGFDRLLNLRNSQDLSAFTDWAWRENATVFQTQLLAYKTELQINAYTSRVNAQNPYEASRRFLFICKDKVGDVSHMVLDLRLPMYLGEAAEKCFKYVRDVKGLEVVAMLNLDPGMHDYAEMWGDYGYLTDCMKGTKPVSAATNLLLYYYE